LPASLDADLKTASRLPARLPHREGEGSRIARSLFGVFTLLFGRAVIWENKAPPGLGSLRGPPRVDELSVPRTPTRSGMGRRTAEDRFVFIRDNIAALLRPQFEERGSALRGWLNDFGHGILSDLSAKGQDPIEFHEEFLLRCADLAEAEAALGRWERSETSVREDRCAEYRELVRDLAGEIEATLDRNA
jgi:hypothetical protein